MNRGNTKLYDNRKTNEQAHFCVENVDNLALEMGNLYSISEMHKVKNFTVSWQKMRHGLTS